jgi:hypothetical protein
LGIDISLQEYTKLERMTRYQEGRNEEENHENGGIQSGGAWGAKKLHFQNGNVTFQ